MATRARRAISTAMLAAVVVAVLAATPALALAQKDGTKTCSPTLIGYVHPYYYNWLISQPPGGSIIYDTPYDGAWHIVEHNGDDGGGYWFASGDNLILASTYAGCRNYG